MDMDVMDTDVDTDTEDMDTDTDMDTVTEVTMVMVAMVMARIMVTARITVTDIKLSRPKNCKRNKSFCNHVVVNCSLTCSVASSEYQGDLVWSVSLGYNSFYNMGVIMIIV